MTAPLTPDAALADIARMRRITDAATEFVRVHRLAWPPETMDSRGPEAAGATRIAWSAAWRRLVDAVESEGPAPMVAAGAPGQT